MSAATPLAAGQLAQQPIAFLCTLRPDGSPHQTPVWFVFIEQTWWVATAADNVKVRNVSRDARVSVALPSPDSSVVAQGSATIHEDNWPVEVVKAFAAKYQGWDVTDSGPDGPRVLLRIATTHWLVPPTGTSAR